MNHVSHGPISSVTVRVPAGTEQFVARLADLLIEMGLGARESEAGIHADEPPVDDLVDSAARWWASLTQMERAIFNLWIEAAPQLVDAGVMAEKLGLSSTNSIRGHIRRVTQKATAVGFQAGWQSHERNPLTGHRMYGLRDFGTGEYAHDIFRLTSTQYAHLLTQARRIAEGG